MDELKQNTALLSEQLDQAWDKLQLTQAAKRLEEIREQVHAPDFWQTNSNETARDASKKLSQLEGRVTPWLALRGIVDEIGEFLALNDDSMRQDLSRKLAQAQKTFEALKKQLRFGGAHDDANALLTIQAGAGGNDAQDWAQMLERMYLRWAEKSQVDVEILAESAGEEAGIKSASLRLSGDFAYGRLKSEHGVHRLVRLSPFNSANSRETSFAMVEVVPEIDSPEDIEVDESDLRVDVFRAGGHGGQSVNTTDSAVRITHTPTGIAVSIQNERSQTQNKETAMRVLKSRLAQLAEEQHQATIDKLKGPNQEAAWGNQIRSYVLHPYTMVKDVRSGYSSADVDKVLNGELDELIDDYLEHTLGK